MSTYRLEKKFWRLQYGKNNVPQIFCKNKVMFRHKHQPIGWKKIPMAIFSPPPLVHPLPFLFTYLCLGYWYNGLIRVYILGPHSPHGPCGCPHAPHSHGRIPGEEVCVRTRRVDGSASSDGGGGGGRDRHWCVTGRGGCRAARAPWRSGEEVRVRRW